MLFISLNNLPYAATAAAHLFVKEEVPLFHKEGLGEI